MLRSRGRGNEHSPSPRTFANIRLTCVPAKAGVQERGALPFLGPMLDTRLCSVLGPGLSRGTIMKQLNVYPLVMLLLAVLFLIAWLGGYL